MMGKWRKYRDMWGVEVGRLMREKVVATGAEKLAEKKASLNPPPSMGQNIPSTPSPYNEKLTMAELPAYCTKRGVEKHVGIYPVISEGEESTVKIVAGTLRSINQAEDNGSMTGQRESEQAQIWEYRQDSRERKRQMSNFEPNAESTPFEKTGARELGAGLLEISEQATELVTK